MALPDSHPIPCIAKDYKPAGESDLVNWLAKEAAGGMQPDDNEEVSKKKSVDLYEDPPGRQDGQNLDARWGVETKGELAHNNEGTFRESKETRTEILRRAFDKLPSVVKQDVDAVSALLDHASSGQFTTRSATLLGKAKLAAPESLVDRVRRITGT